MVRKAYQYVLKEKDTVHVVKNAAGVVVCYYLLAQTQTAFKKISASLVAKYEAARTGFVPAGTGGKWEKVLPICASMYKVEVVASDGRQVLACVSSTLTSSRAKCARDLRTTASASTCLL